MALLALPLSAKNSGLEPHVCDCKLKLILSSLQKWEEAVFAQKTVTYKALLSKVVRGFLCSALENPRDLKFFNIFCNNIL